jgi:hypothetical protein
MGALVSAKSRQMSSGADILSRRPCPTPEGEVARGEPIRRRPLARSSCRLASLEPGISRTRARNKSLSSPSCLLYSVLYVRTIQYGNASLNCYLRAGIRCMDCFLFVVINSASWSNRKTHKQCQPTVQTMPRRDSGPHSALGAIVVLPGSPVFAAPG